ncbi:uncharacterized protein LY79DRAFT_558252 [Colletotrichum navitas]|uniref:Uncharacterized protein n=1 Tax=Colletotrichum navitas TaxID=681940 RepID=A0AAD8V353_9PEZI|nr:uncharacterized protein LY79DRAFT_558252 [Colletotrichum navitas]KAK1585518.1 hypothetical protein LY79DRAFT_558252 [Colletotrichum navitas]
MRPTQAKWPLRSSHSDGALSVPSCHYCLPLYAVPPPARQENGCINTKAQHPLRRSASRPVMSRSGWRYGLLQRPDRPVSSQRATTTHQFRSWSRRPRRGNGTKSQPSQQIRHPHNSDSVLPYPSPIFPPRGERRPLQHKTSSLIHQSEYGHNNRGQYTPQNAAHFRISRMLAPSGNPSG